MGEEKKTSAKVKVEGKKVDDKSKKINPLDEDDIKLLKTYVRFLSFVYAKFFNLHTSSDLYGKAMYLRDCLRPRQTCV